MNTTKTPNKTPGDTGTLLATIATSDPRDADQVDVINEAFRKLCDRHTQAHALSMLSAFAANGFFWDDSLLGN